MICHIGIGSNLGNRIKNLEGAAKILREKSNSKIRVAPIFQTSALILKGAPESWRMPFLNSVVEMEWNESPFELLELLKSIEIQMGRSNSEKWSPRCIDLDIVFFGSEKIVSDNLKIPHERFADRSFVLGPLKHLIPNFIPPGHTESLLMLDRKLELKSPAFMEILNITPDSFSDGGCYNNEVEISALFDSVDKFHVPIIDVGAESTRPGAITITPEEEWRRLRPILEFFNSKYRNTIFRPKLSVDTRYSVTARKCTAFEIDCINDVGGSGDEMVKMMVDNSCDLVMMHSLSVPADSSYVLDKECDPVKFLKNWAISKIEHLLKNGVSIDRIIFDPGVGFGKTSEQSLEIVRRINEFMDLPVRILVGHSRKSFIKNFFDTEAKERDPESIGISMCLAKRGVDILRVHKANFHQRAWLAGEMTS